MLNFEIIYSSMSSSHALASRVNKIGKFEHLVRHNLILMYAIANNNNNSNHPDQSDSSEDEDMEVEEETPGETTLEASSKLLRYLYIGNDINVIISQRYRQVDLRDLDVRLEFINELAALRPNLPFQFIKRIMLSNTLWRKDEAILALAYCLRRLTTVVPEEYIKLKTEIYNSLHLLLKTDSDLFLFVYLSQKILTDVNGRKSFGRGMKRALFRWYEKKSPEELAEMFGRNRGMYGWTHANIIYLCHMKFGTDAKSQLISTLFKRGSESIAEQQSMETLPPAVRRFFDICSLKVNESATDAAEKIELHNFDADNLPVHLISQHQVWNKLLPKMEYRQLLKIFQTLHSLNLLKPKIPLYSTMCESLGSSQSIKKACMHPLEIYSIHNLYKKNARYNETIKVAHLVQEEKG
ncbi:RNA-binding protein RO60 [Pseudolycoriella hygida]|uniref:RNA-binding protein RO60 n=1 Tax=Pseudolycoriella hygida TaxID=35572 RepID=A0A9Q0RWE9_9DIPT|nr:RNA-binding protein RO60 [Pseudolycoriella hygida]